MKNTMQPLRNPAALEAAAHLGSRTRYHSSPLSNGWAVAEPAGNPNSGAADSNCFLRSAGVRFLLMVASVAVTDQTIELWVGTKPEHLKILGLEFNYNAVVLRVTMIVAVFSGLSFAATTSSDDRHARDFLEPMVLRLRKILMIRDIYLPSSG